jgi:hypothetical protein
MLRFIGRSNGSFVCPDALNFFCLVRAEPFFWLWPPPDFFRFFVAIESSPSSVYFL